MGSNPEQSGQAGFKNAGDGKALNVIPVDGGAYIVKVGKRVAKVVVK